MLFHGGDPSRADREMLERHMREIRGSSARGRVGRIERARRFLADQIDNDLPVGMCAITLITLITLITP